MLIRTFHHEGTPRAQIPFQGMLTLLGNTIIIASRDNYRLDILANHRDEGGVLKAEYIRVDIFANGQETFEGSKDEIMRQFKMKIKFDVWEQVKDLVLAG